MLKFIKLIPVFISIMGKKQKVDEKEYNFVLFRIDLYFSEYDLAVEIDEKGHTDIYLVAENKRQKALEKNLTSNLLGLIHAKKVMMCIIKLVEDKHLLANLKTKK